MRGGATDYVLKHHPERLVPAVQRALRETRERALRENVERQNSILARLGQSLSSVTRPDEAARVILQIADEMFGLDAFTLDLYDAQADEFRPVLSVDVIEGRRTEVKGHARSSKPSLRARRIMSSGRELILRPVSDPRTEDEDARPFGDINRLSESLMLAPLRERDVVIGVISIQSYTPFAYTTHDLDAFQTLADYCGGALERIRAQQVVRESAQQFEDLFEGSPDAIYVEDLKGIILDVNHAACQLQGLPREKIIGHSFLEFVPEEKRESARNIFEMLASEEVFSVESESWTADGRATPVEVRTGRIPFRGKPAVLLHVRDISARKTAEAAARSSEMLFHAVWENSVDGMRLTDADGKVIAINEAYCKLVGISRSEIEGKPLTSVYADSEHPDQMLQDYCKRFQSRNIKRQAESRLVMRTGKSLTLEFTASFVELRGREPMVLTIFRDVSNQKKLEEQFRQAQKMEAIGQLAGGVAHDFNNILTVIHGHASLLLADSRLPESAASSQQIIESVERAAALTRQLLTFSRRQVLETRRLDINEVVSRMGSMLGRLLGEDVTMQVRYWPQPAFVQADRGMVEQIILNLAVNARDAMPKGGQISLQINPCDIDQSHVQQQPQARAGRFVCLSVTDTGTGIPADVLPHIFEPFFTTKEVGKGTGLGLATVYGIVKQHSGWLEVETEAGRGTSFKIYLPALDEMPGHAETSSRETAVAGGNETVLIVEDEKAVRELVSGLLKRRGYRVLEAESGAKALQLWSEHKGRVDLLLTDMVMPDRISGWELAQKLLPDQPTLKVIFTSGYSEEVVGREFALRVGVNYLPKPYHPQTLARVIRERLDAKESGV